MCVCINTSLEIIIFFSFVSRSPNSIPIYAYATLTNALCWTQVESTYIWASYEKNKNWWWNRISLCVYSIGQVLYIDWCTSPKSPSYKNFTITHFENSIGIILVGISTVYILYTCVLSYFPKAINLYLLFSIDSIDYFFLYFRVFYCSNKKKITINCTYLCVVIHHL